MVLVYRRLPRRLTSLLPPALCALLLLLLGGIAIRAQPSPSPHATLAPRGRLTLNVVVTDAGGIPVPGLTAQDFVLNDNANPTPILGFSAAGPDMPPAQIVFVLDTIRQSALEAENRRNALQYFLRQNGGRLSQPATIYLAADDGIFVAPSASADGNLLADQIGHRSRLRPLPYDFADVGVTLLATGVRPSFRDSKVAELEALGAIVLDLRRSRDRKLVAWVGASVPYRASQDEKLDLFSQITEFSTRLREARITLFSVHTDRGTPKSPGATALVGIRTPEQATTLNLAVEVLAIQSGGGVLSEEQLPGALAHPNSYYTLSFRPPTAVQPDEYHPLEVELRRPGLVAHTNTGYYNQPVFYDQPRVPAERVTVAQLNQLLGGQGTRDSDLAHRLAGLELTDRVSGAELDRWRTRMPGPRALAELVALVDASAFLAPPADPASPAPPPVEAQRVMLSHTATYLGKVLPTLPNFSATRITSSYREPVPRPGESWKTATGDLGLHLAGSGHATVLYLSGFEVVDAGTRKKPGKGKPSLDTKGTFGSILPVLSEDVLSQNPNGPDHAAESNSGLSFVRWEPGPGEPRAVFSYRVPAERSHYQLAYRAILDDGASVGAFQVPTGYHGELTIDPGTGTILRFTLEADQPHEPILRSSIAVEFAPITVAAHTCTCLARSVTLLRERSIFNLREWGTQFSVYGPYHTVLDDSAFSDYRLFHGEARILTDPQVPAQPSPPGT